MLQVLQDIKEEISMSKITKTLKNKKSFIAFLTAGDPDLDTSERYILKMAESGADLIEIGIAFSDPIAEGKVIEQANLRALSSGTKIDAIFDMIKRVRLKIDTPLVFLTYLNPVFNYGYEAFFKRCEECGINGIILPDLPFDEKTELQDIRPYAQEHNVNIISLIAPTSKERIKQIAKQAKGFIYLVSSMGVTGVRSEIKTDLEAMTAIIKSVTDIPVCVGFGISTPEQAKTISAYADGVIVGSAIVKIIEKHRQNADGTLENYVKSMKEAISEQDT